MYTEWFAHTQAQTVYIAWPHAIRYFMTTVMLDECWSTLSKAHMQLLLVQMTVQHILIPE